VTVKRGNRSLLTNISIVNLDWIPIDRSDIGLFAGVFEMNKPIDIANAKIASSRVESKPARRGDGILPGLVLTSVVAAAAFTIKTLPPFTIFSPMILAVIVGIVFANVVGVPEKTNAGLVFSQKGLLRFAIGLLGFQLTASQVISIGTVGLLAVIIPLVATFFFTVFVGRALGVDSKLTELLAAGTSVCGASAIVATNSVTCAREEDVAYSVAAITLFGTVAMLTYPFLGSWMGLTAHDYGLWAGASIHEVPQVVAATFQNGPIAGETGTVAKLGRVAMLAPMIVALGIFARHKAAEASARPPVPWFIFGFAAAVACNSIFAIPPEAKQILALVTAFLLTMGLAAMGLRTDISHVRLRGFRPLLLAFFSTVFIAMLSLVIIRYAS
jgi:uncharacterized integral membrane protein (TIGR00698 family)